MNKNFRYPIIAACLLVLSILMLPNVDAAREGITRTAIDSSSSKSESANVSRSKMARFALQQEEPTPQDTADLSVTKLVDSEQATPGTNLTYTITVHNNEPDSATLVTMEDELPGNLEFVSLAKPVDWICTTPMVGDGGTITCTTPALAGNADAVFTLVASVPANTVPGTSYTNIATVSSPTFDPNEENNSASATSTVLIKSPDLHVTKVADSDDVNAGENVTYTITVHNGETYNADNATLNDTLPGNTTFVSLTKPDAWTCTTPAVGSGGTVSCTNPSFAANSDDVFILVVNVPANTPPTESYTNTATVGSSMPDSNEENNSASATTTISNADLEVLKVDTPDPGSAGSNLTYTITLRNNGPNDAEDVSLSDTLPAGTTFVSLSEPSGWTCTEPAVGSGGTVNCSIAAFVTESAVFILVVKVDSSVSFGTIITNTATVTSSTTHDPISGNNTGEATTTIMKLRAWTTAGNSSVTEDESNPARPTYTNFTAAVGSGAPAGTYVLRYNIQATDGLSGPGTNTRLRARFRDEGEGSRVIIAIMRSSILGGVATLGTIFDSDLYTPHIGFQTQEIIMSPLTFDFTQNFYWLEVTLTKSGTTNQPGFGSAQINRQ